MTALHHLSAHEVACAYRAKELSPVEVARAALGRVSAWEKKINAMYVVDAEGALATAAASEARWRAGVPLSALDGT
jgi:aspartyl-tRNA(Asn)/glutamyl-tRNA(Gln) amidotransferase subunit A